MGSRQHDAHALPPLITNASARAMKAATSRVRTVALMTMLAGAAAGCGSGITGPTLSCPDAQPDIRADGTWRGQVGGRELTVTLKQRCALVFLYPLWVVSGTWAWGGVSSGTALFDPNLSLTASYSTGTFRGLTIKMNESPPYNSTLTGSADGELPLTGSESGAWQSFSNLPVTLSRTAQ